MNVHFLKDGILFVPIAFFTFLFSNAQFSPISLHPSNPHYFLYEDKPVVLITSGEHYGAVLNVDFNYQKYLDQLRIEGLNLTRIFSGAYLEAPGAFNIQGNTLAPLPHRFIAPWPRTDSAGHFQGGNKFDLDKWDDNYFNRLKQFLLYAAGHDIIVELTLFCPFYEDTLWLLSPMHPRNNINNIPAMSRTDVYTLDRNGPLLERQKKLVRKIVTELNEYDNLIFEICNEPYFGGVTMVWQHSIADVISETEKTLPKKHLISQNIANGYSVIRNPHPAVSVFNFHYAYPPYALRVNYHLNKAIGDNETGFRGNSDSTYRFEGWRFIIAGGSLYNNLDYSFAVGYEDGTFVYPPTQPGGGTLALRRQLGDLKKFISSFDFIRMKPDSTFVDGLANGVSHNGLAEHGKQYALYLKGQTINPITLNLPSGKYLASWMHPSTGIYEPQLTVVSKKGEAVIKPPAYRDDIALKLSRRK